MWLALAAIMLIEAKGFSSRWKWSFRKQASGSVPTANGGGERMLLYEMLIAIGIAVVLVVAAIDRLAARVMMGLDEMALLRLARAAAAQHRLVASVAPAGAGSASRSSPASPAPPRSVLDARTRGTAPSASRYAHHSTRNTGRERLKRGSRIILRQGARTMKDTGQRQ